jgi:4,5-DOPA dioxygenase extradiol
MTAERQRMPALFVGHGNPMNAIERNQFHLSWEALGQQLPRPKAVLCISAHWQTQGVRLSASQHPETIHDFRGFPKALFEVAYPARGDPELARHIADLLSDYQAGLDFERGLDHGAWSILVAMYPNADVPVVQLSLDATRPAAFHYRLAKQLAPLRDEGVLILGSGNIVHNLRSFSFANPEPLDWAVEFDAEVKRRILLREHEALIDPGSLGEHAKLAIPTDEHFLPLLYALAVRNEGDPLGFFNDVVLSSISMTSVLVGERTPA